MMDDQGLSRPAGAANDPVPSVVDEEITFDDDQGEAATEWKRLPPEREFFATPYDPPVKSLVQEIRDKELIVRPTFQRYAVWDPVRKSKFVESILLNIPIPTLFFAEDDDQTKVVVDGQQRLLALKEFLDNAYALKGLEVLSPLKGKRFDDLTDRQKKIIRNRTLRCLLISAKSDSEIRFQVFERLNQGGVPLNAQEVRHCVYRGTLNDLLHRLVSKPAWLHAFGLERPHTRMNDCEQVLRFLALRDVLPNYAPPLKKLLNDFMRDHRHADEAECQVLESAFDSALDVVVAAFRNVSFRRVFLEGQQLNIDKAPNRAVFDVQMLIMEGISLDWARERSSDIVKAFAELLRNDQTFMDSVSKATADKARLSYRLRTWRATLEKLGATVPMGHRAPDIA